MRNDSEVVRGRRSLKCKRSAESGVWPDPTTQRFGRCPRAFENFSNFQGGRAGEIAELGEGATGATRQRQFLQIENGVVFRNTRWFVGRSVASGQRGGGGGEGGGGVDGDRGKAESRALATDAAGQLHVARHDGDALGVDGAQVGVLEQAHQVRLGRLLERHDG